MLYGLIDYAKIWGKWIIICIIVFLMTSYPNLVVHLGGIETRASLNFNLLIKSSPQSSSVDSIEIGLFRMRSANFSKHE